MPRAKNTYLLTADDPRGSSRRHAGLPDIPTPFITEQITFPSIAGQLPLPNDPLV